MSWKDRYPIFKIDRVGYDRDIGEDKEYSGEKIFGDHNNFNSVYSGNQLWR